MGVFGPYFFLNLFNFVMESVKFIEIQNDDLILEAAEKLKLFALGESCAKVKDPEVAKAIHELIDGDHGEIVKQSDLSDQVKLIIHDLENVINSSRIGRKTFESCDWSVDVGLSSSHVLKLLEPSINLTIRAKNPQDGTLEVMPMELTVQQFGQLRFKVAEALKNMIETEKRLNK